MDTITSGNHTFEVVESVQNNYIIWNIGSNMIDGYLPLAELVDEYTVDQNTLKAIKLANAQTILSAIGGGQNTIESMERYVKRYRNAKPNTYSYRQKERMLKALPVMMSIKWN